MDIQYTDIECLLTQPAGLPLLTVVVMSPTTIKHTLRRLYPETVYWFTPACTYMAFIQQPARQQWPMSGLSILMSMTHSHPLTCPPPHCRVHLDHVWCSFSSTIVGRSKRYFLGSDWKWYAINKNITTQYSPIKSGFGQWRNHFYAHTICAKAIVRAHRKSLKNRLTPASFSFIFVFSN